MAEEAQDLCLQHANIFDVSSKHSADMPQVAGQAGCFRTCFQEKALYSDIMILITKARCVDQTIGEVIKRLSCIPTT
jgi:hypothetical protein